ncbi:MAG TPA: hypothetical protein VGF30_11935, partial [Bacteroidia bacterium]
MGRKKTKREQYPFIHKHYLIPLALCGLLVIGGIIMILTDQVDGGTVYIRSSGKNVIITGPVLI